MKRRRNGRRDGAAVADTAALPSAAVEPRPWAPYRVLVGPRDAVRTRDATPLLQHAVLPYQADAPAPPPFLPVPARETLAQRRLRARQELFLAAFRRLGTVAAAALAVGVEPRTHGHWRAGSEDYRAAYARVRVEAVELLETEARRRALYGVDELILVGGRPVLVQESPGGPARLLTKKVYSDSLLAFLLKANKPGKYREFHGAVPLGAAGGGDPDAIAGDDFDAGGLEFDWERVSAAELETVRTILVKARGYAVEGTSAAIGRGGRRAGTNGGGPGAEGGAP